MKGDHLVKNKNLIKNASFKLKGNDIFWGGDQ